MPSTLRSAARNRESIWKLGGLSLRELGRNVIRGAEESELFSRASGLAFDFLLALFPLLFILLAAFGLFTSHSVQLRTSLLAYFADFLPPLAFQLLQRTTEELVMSASGGKLTAGIFGSLWFASGGVASIISALNVAFRAKETRSWFKVRAIALALTVAIFILVFSALCIVLVGEDVVDWTGRQLRLASALIAVWKALQWPTAMLFMILAYALIYTFGPNLKQKQWHLLTPGAVFATIVWMIASAAFRIYLRYVNNYTVIFGSLGALVILLIWLYATGVAFLAGGEINASIARAIEQNQKG